MFNLFKRKKKIKKDIFEQGDFNMNDINVLEEHEFMVSLLYANPMINTIYPACAACYGISEEKNKTVEEKIAYIGRRVKSHHTSILEHSNVVLQAFIPLKELNDSLFDKISEYNKNIKSDLTDFSNSDQCTMYMVSEVKDVCRYLTTYTDVLDINDVPVMRITFGGSIRGYRYIFENIENRKNKLFISIFEVLKRVVPAAFFADFINDGVMNNYTTLEITNDLADNIYLYTFKETNDKIDIINYESLEQISKLTKLPFEKCFDFCSITVNFKNMSRIITQQVTRHRNGITQESQRYVNYSNASFNSPSKFKDKYDREKVYDTPFGQYNMVDLGYLMSSVYRYLIDQGVDKEDARGFLPSNVQCGKLFVTFTLRTLLVFLNLRLDSHAQAEIRQYAEVLAEMTNSYCYEIGIVSMEYMAQYYSEPIYKRVQNTDLYNEIDEEV